MEAKESKIQEILTENKKYFIPEYQRPYSWSIDNVTQLLDDLETSFSNKDIEYFIGSMICIKKDNNFFEVVDGQQRLTTLSLILTQLSKIITNQGVKDELKKRVLPIDVFTDKPTEPRLIVRKKEFNLYKYYILQDQTNYKPTKPTDTEQLFIENSECINNYLTQKSQPVLIDFAKYILQNVFCVFVTTDSFASSFRLFNVLNNRGLPLNNSDLLKNSLFEYSEANQLNKIQVEENWQDIENLIGVKNFDKFLSLNKISEKKDRNRVTKQDYESYLQTLKVDFNGDAVAMSISLLNSAKNYTRIIDIDFSEFNDKALERRIKTLSNLTNDEWIPTLLAFLNKTANSSSLIKKEDFPKFVEIFESVYIQGWIKKQIKSQRETVAYTALSAINTDKNFDEIVNAIINHADDTGFIKALDQPIYEPRPNQVSLLRAILMRIDMEMQDLSVAKTYNGRITIEHILPQKINNEYWQKEFNTSEHEYWVHRLGNLTLISGHKNSEAQNSDFPKKKSIYKKLNNRVSFDITKDVYEKDIWNKENISERHEILKKMIRKIWSTKQYQNTLISYNK